MNYEKIVCILEKSCIFVKIEKEKHEERFKKDLMKIVKKSVLLPVCYLYETKTMFLC